MDANQASELLDGLPFSSNIAIKVFLEALRGYIAAFEHNEVNKTAFESRLRQAILTAEFRDGQISNDEGERLGLILRSAMFSENECLEAGLSNGVGIQPWRHLENPSSLVSGWISPNLSQYQTSFREALPLPEENRFTDCSRTDNEWLVIFWAIFELNPENRRRSLVPPSSDDADIPELFPNIHQRRPIQKLVDCLKRVGPDDIARFKTGRETVVASLLEQCLRHSLQRVRRGPNGFDLVAFDNDSTKHPKPESLTVWKSAYWPKTDSVDAIRQWIACTVQALEQWQASLQAPAKGDDVISAGIAQQACQDAVQSARRCRERHGITNAPERPKDESLTAVLWFLDELEQAVSAAPIETSSGGKLDKPTSVATTTLREPQTQLVERFEKAYRAYKWAEQQLVIRGAENVTDRQAWEFLTEHGFDGYKPESFDTWQRYVREARKFHDERKNTRRGGREGGSIVREGETDAPMQPE